jgi:hypothetical protein
LVIEGFDGSCHRVTPNLHSSQIATTVQTRRQAGLLNHDDLRHGRAVMPFTHDSDAELASFMKEYEDPASAGAHNRDTNEFVSFWSYAMPVNRQLGFVRMFVDIEQL